MMIFCRSCWCRRRRCLTFLFIMEMNPTLTIIVFWFACLQYYDPNVRIRVEEINGRAIGREITQRCGNEGQHPYLNDVDWTTLRFLRAANSFIPDARDDGANMRNCAFILRQPGRDFFIISGNGDWEYDFCEDADREIYGRCVRKPFLRYAWEWSQVMRCSHILLRCFNCSKIFDGRSFYWFEGFDKLFILFITFLFTYV